MSSTARILVTRQLSREQLEYARSLGLNPVLEPSIRFEFPDVGRTVRTVVDRYPEAPWVFTSKNGVRALKTVFGFGNPTGEGTESLPGRDNRTEDRESSGGEKPAPAQWNRPGLGLPDVYGVGEKTGEALSRFGLQARTPERQDAAGLAALILKDLSERSATARRVIHWCGNLSRPELNEKLKAGGVELVRLEVYRTQLNRMDLPDDPGQGILFFSPSAVDAFRKSGGFQKALPELFAIGNTTGELLSMESGRPVHIPQKPTTEALLELVSDVLGVGGEDLRQNAERKRQK